MNIDPKTLAQLAEIIELQSFSAAAERLGTTQPGLSKMVATLEKRLNAKVLAQPRRRVVPTELGRRLAELGAVIRSAAASAGVLAGRALRGAIGHVRVGAPPFICDSLIPRLVSSFREVHPAVSFEIVPAYVDELRLLVHQNRLDFALGPIALQHDRLNLSTSVTLVMRHAIICCPGNPLRGRKRIAAHDLEKAEWIGHSSRSALHRIMRDCLTVAGVTQIVPVVTSEAAGAIFNLLRQTNSLTVLPVLSVIDQLEAGELSVLPIALEETKIQFGTIAARSIPDEEIVGAFKRHCVSSLIALETRSRAFLPRQA